MRHLVGRYLGSVVSVALAALLVFPAAAGAEQFQGTTDQGHGVALVVSDADGLVHLVIIDWVADCGEGKQLVVPTRFDGPFEGATTTSFQTGGSYIGTGRPNRKLRFRISVHIRGWLVDEQWAGVISGKAGVFRKGERIDRCRLDGTGWSASPIPR